MILEQSSESFWRRRSVRLAAAIMFLLLLPIGFYAFVTLAFGISYPEPLMSTLSHGAGLFCVILVQICYAKIVLAGVFPKPISLIKSTLLAVVSFAILICLAGF